MIPAKLNRIDVTIAKTGRKMKNFAIAFGSGP
jgi:hypothetical protein